MRYIVLYTMAMIWITTSETAAQKPAFDLLPASNEHVHPEAVIDTCFTNESPVLLAPGKPAPSSPAVLSNGTGNGKDKRQKGNDTDPLFKRRNSNKVQESMKPGFNPLIIKHINPIRFLIYMTALNI